MRKAISESFLSICTLICVIGVWNESPLGALGWFCVFILILPNTIECVWTAVRDFRMK